jgi:hypothetical protein
VPRSPRGEGRVASLGKFSTVSNHIITLSHYHMICQVNSPIICLVNRQYILTLTHRLE